MWGVKKQLFTEDGKIILSDEDRRLINIGVNKKFAEMEPKDVGSRLIEPIFIMEVKWLLEDMTSKLK